MRTRRTTLSQSTRWLVTRDSRGMAFITTLFVLFALGMMLVGLVFMTQNEAFLAARSRNAAIAFNIADAGIQEALARLSLFTIVPGATTFTASLPTTSSLSSSTVAFKAPLTFAGQTLMIYPVTSTATFANTTRVARAYMLATFKPGMSNVIFTPNANFNADARPVSGDTYSAASINYQSGNVPQCSAGASATNLPSPQVFAGTQIIWQSVGTGCNAGGSGNYTSNDCNSDTSLSEVAPTACGGSAGGRFVGLPFNFHPMTPIGMPQGDFIEVLNAACGAGCGHTPLPPGISIVQATQSGTRLTYPTPTGVGGYPTSGCPGGTCVGDVWLIKTSALQKQFCVDSVNHTVTTSLPCVGATNNTYGDPTNPVRFLDWGLVLTDTTKGLATTFFQAPSCTAPCPFPGFQNGIRYIPPPPNINLNAKACTVNVNPGTNVVDYVSPGTNPGCSAPIVTHNNATETFSGTKSNPESLIIFNGPPGSTVVTINGTIQPGALPGSCNPLSWFDTNANWGQIMASGDLSFGATFSFAGFLYAGGNITFNSDTAIWGAVVSTKSNTYATLNSTTTFCGGSQVSMLNPNQMNFSQWAWEDRDAMPDTTVPPASTIR